MKLLFQPLYIVSCLLLASCASSNFGVRTEPKYETKTFYLKLTSDPEGVTVVSEQRGRREALGKTPLRIPFVFVKKPSDSFIGQMGWLKWQHKTPTDSPWRLLEVPEGFQLRLSKLSLEKSGYEHEEFSTIWKLNKDFQARNLSGEVTGAEALQTEGHVIMQNPTKPEFIRKITIESVPLSSKIYALNEDGSQGKMIGEAPIQFNFGFARKRNKMGEILKWTFWHEKERTGLFSFDKMGVLQISALLEAENFEPEVIHLKPVLTVSPDQQNEYTEILRSTTPAVAQTTFALSVDSLPSEAEVFELMDDGTLGKKIGVTPFQINIGLGQQLELAKTGTYLHKDWLLWVQNKLVKWDTDDQGVTTVYLACGIYRDGFATEKVFQEVFKLVPGRQLPTERTLTIPLLHPEQAAVRDAKRLTPSPVPATGVQAAPARQPFVWKEPEPNVVAETPNEEKKSFFHRFKRKN